MVKSLQDILSDIQELEKEATKVELLEQQRLKELETLEQTCQEEGVDVSNLDAELTKLEEEKDVLLDKIIEICELVESKIDEALKDG